MFTLLPRTTLSEHPINIQQLIVSKCPGVSTVLIYYIHVRHRGYRVCDTVYQH